MCTLYVLFYLSGTNTPHRQYWLQLPLPIVRNPSRANGGAPVPAPMVALPFRHLLTFVRPTPVPLSPHQVYLSHSSLVCSNYPANGGAPVLLLLFWRALTTFRLTPVPPTPHPVHHSHHSHLSHPSHTCNNYVSSSSHYYPIESSRYDPDPEIPRDTSIQRYDTAIRYDPSSQYSRYNSASQYTTQPANTQSDFFYLFYIPC